MLRHNMKFFFLSFVKNGDMLMFKNKERKVFLVQCHQYCRETRFRFLCFLKKYFSFFVICSQFKFFLHR